MVGHMWNYQENWLGSFVKYNIIKTTQIKQWQQIQLTWCQINLTPERDNQTREW
jgi:hypothetical protein